LSEITAGDRLARVPPNDLLYDLVGLSFLTSSRVRYLTEAIFPPGFAMRPGQLHIACHRSESDVPMICGELWFAKGLGRHGPHRYHYAARDDLYVPHAVAYALPMPLPLRRLAARVPLGAGLEAVRTHPVRRTGPMKLVQALEALPPELRVEDAFGPDLLARLGHTGARTVGELLSIRSGHRLWIEIAPEDIAPAHRETIERDHGRQAAAGLRRLVDILRAGSSMLVFPEGRVSEDGAIGPLGAAVEVLIRRGRPAEIVPIAIAYDPLRRGRVVAHAGFGPPQRPPADGIGAHVLREVRRAMPLTTGQVLAEALLGAVEAGRQVLHRDDLAEALEQEVRRALAEARPLPRSLRDPLRRRARLDDALRAAGKRGLLDVEGPGITPVAEAVLASGLVRRLATEGRSAADLEGATA
jgi:hypothetical protein